MARRWSNTMGNPLQGETIAFLLCLKKNGTSQKMGLGGGERQEQAVGRGTPKLCLRTRDSKPGIPPWERGREEGRVHLPPPSLSCKHLALQPPAPRLYFAFLPPTQERSPRGTPAGLGEGCHPRLARALPLL